MCRIYGELLADILYKIYNYIFIDIKLKILVLVFISVKPETKNGWPLNGVRPPPPLLMSHHHVSTGVKTGQTIYWLHIMFSGHYKRVNPP